MALGRRPGPQGFWDDFKDEIESARQSLVGADARYQLFAQGWFGFDQDYAGTGRPRSPSAGIFFGSPFGISGYELEKALGGAFPHTVTYTAQRFVEEIVQRIKNAADWKTLDAIAKPLVGPLSLHAGILYGIGESLVGDVAGLLALAKLVALAGLYERIKQSALLDFSDPLTLTLTVAVRQIPSLYREAEKADEQLWKTLGELKEIALHPIKFIEIVGQSAWKGVVKDWNDLKYATLNQSISNDFAAGRIMGRTLYQIVMMILLVMSVAGAVAKLATRFPWLMSLARIISRGGKLEELEKVGQGARAAKEAESIPKETPRPQKPQDETPVLKPPKKPSYIHGASDGGPGQWGKPTSGRNTLGQAYQELVTGAPPGTEYKVPYEANKSGFVDFDGYDPERNTLLDAKDWNKWPPATPEGLRDSAIKKILSEARDQQAAANGTPIEWHVPTDAKAAEIQEILARGRISGIDVVVTPKP